MQEILKEFDSSSEDERKKKKKSRKMFDSESSEEEVIPLRKARGREDEALIADNDSDASFHSNDGINEPASPKVSTTLNGDSDSDEDVKPKKENRLVVSHCV